MKKRIFRILSCALAVALLAVVCFSVPALAKGDGDVEVVVSPITVTPWDDYYEYSKVTVSGNIVVNADASAFGLFPRTEANAEGGYSIVNPNGDIVYSDTQSDYDSDRGWIWSDSEASVTIPWTVTFQLNGVGDWAVAQYGEGSYDWSYWLFKIWKGSGSSSDENSTKFYCKYDNRGELQVGCPFGIATTLVWGDSRATIGDLFVVGDFKSGQYVIVIPKGTIVTDKNGSHPLQLYISDIANNVPVFVQTVTFSQICTLYKVDSGHLYQTQLREWVGGTLVKVGTFTGGSPLIGR